MMAAKIQAAPEARIEAARPAMASSPIHGPTKWHRGGPAGIGRSRGMGGVMRDVVDRSGQRWASSGTSTRASGVPQPVTGSQPGRAG